MTVSARTTIWAFAIAAAVFTVLLITGALVVSSVRAETLRPLRMTGSAVRRWGGLVLMAVGTWFIVLALLPSPLLSI